MILKNPQRLIRQTKNKNFSMIESDLSSDRKEWKQNVLTIFHSHQFLYKNMLTL